MSKDLTHMTRIECHKLRAKWTHILGVLRLNGAQSRQLVELRKSHLANLRVLYEDRQRLNMQARRTCCGVIHGLFLRWCIGMRAACMFLAQSAWLLCTVANGMPHEELRAALIPLVHLCATVCPSICAASPMTTALQDCLGRR